MFPQCGSVSRALGMWDRLEPSLDLRGDAGKTFGKRVWVMPCWLQLYPTPQGWELYPTPHNYHMGNYFNEILGGLC